MRYNLCETVNKLYFIECTKNDIYTYHRTDAEKNIEEATETFIKLESYTNYGFEECSDSNCTRQEYIGDYKILLSFDLIPELLNFLKDFNE